MLMSSGSEKAGQVHPAMKGHGHEVDGNGEKQKGRVHVANEGSFRGNEKVVTKRVNGAALLSRSAVALQPHGVGLARVERRLFLER
jgi:hypothetical protein